MNKVELIWIGGASAVAFAWGLAPGCGEDGHSDLSGEDGGTDGGTDGDADTDADTDTDSDSDTDTDSDADTDSDTDADVDAGADAGADAGTDTDVTNGCTDLDDDGWCAPFDCDDGDPNVHPVAPEAPENHADDDCDGVTDETLFIAGGLPSDVGGSFTAGAVDTDRAPTLVYPPDGVLLPPNLVDVEFQWNGGAGNDAWRVEFDGAGADAVAYVDTPSFVPSGALWHALTWGNAGGQFTVTVRGITLADPSTYGESATITVNMAEQEVRGGLYYWAATSVVGEDYGIFRYDFGEAGQPAEAVYTAQQLTDTDHPGGRCVACHALSHDGTRMALNYDGGNGIADIVDVATRETLVPAGGEYYANFHTYSPDDTYVLSVRSGVFTLRDGTTGAAVETLGLSEVTYPDWSRDGSQVAFTRSLSFGGADWTFGLGQIEIMGFGGVGSWGTPEVLVPSVAGTNFYYPAISPDGEWVLFNRSTGDSYSDDDATLWVVSAEGGDPIPLDALNLTGDLRTSWAKWCPFEHELNGEPLFWITVSSLRDYGNVLVGQGLPQIWMAGFSPSRAADGLDPSWPAFWLPFQDLTTNNHIPQWTEVVVPLE